MWNLHGASQTFSWGHFLVAVFFFLCRRETFADTRVSLCVWVLKVRVVVMILLLRHTGCLWVLNQSHQLFSAECFRAEQQGLHGTLVMGFLRALKLLCPLTESCSSHWLSVLMPSLIKHWGKHAEKHSNVCQVRRWFSLYNAGAKIPRRTQNPSFYNLWF